MEQIVEVARSLREDHDFRGYIHLKTIPDADPELVQQAGLYADRVSINVELPTAPGLKRLAPEKSATRIEGAMGGMKGAIDDGKDAKKKYRSAPTLRAGGPIDADDRRRRRRERWRYRRARRARSTIASACAGSIIRPSRPIPDASAVLPLQRPPLMREHRLYQSDWLMRFYGFKPEEVVSAADEGGHAAARHRSQARLGAQVSRLFPGRCEPSASKEQLLRVPGLGTKAVGRILSSRRLPHASRSTMSRG